MKNYVSLQISFLRFLFDLVPQENNYNGKIKANE